MDAKALANMGSDRNREAAVAVALQLINTSVGAITGRPSHLGEELGNLAHYADLIEAALKRDEKKK